MKIKLWVFFELLNSLTEEKPTAIYRNYKVEYKNNRFYFKFEGLTVNTSVYKEHTFSSALELEKYCLFDRLKLSEKIAVLFNPSDKNIEVRQMGLFRDKVYCVSISGTNYDKRYFVNYLVNFANKGCIAMPIEQIGFWLTETQIWSFSQDKNLLIKHLRKKVL